jgi:hypothetical protein
MSKAKYIVYERKGQAFETVVVFPANVPHDEIGRGIQPDAKLVSAGFVHIRPIYKPLDNPQLEVECYGASDSLGLKSRGQEDDDIIRRFLK